MIITRTGVKIVELWCRIIMTQYYSHTRELQTGADWHCTTKTRQHSVLSSSDSTSALHRGVGGPKTKRTVSYPSFGSVSASLFLLALALTVRLWEQHHSPH